MNYRDVFQVSSQVNCFVKDSMVGMGRSPHKVSVEFMMWRLSQTVVGSEMLKRYSRAMKNPDLWRETVAYMLQGLAGILRAVEMLARGANAEKVAQTLNSREKIKLKELANAANSKCSARGYKTGELFTYIMECRNVYVHSGIMPYLIEEDGRQLGLNDFLKTKFKDNPMAMAAMNQGSSIFNSKGDNKRFRALCNLILAAFSFYFDSVNPSFSKNPFWHSIELYFSMAGHAIGKAVAYSIMSVYAIISGGGALVKIMITGAIYIVIALVVLVIISKLIGLIGLKKSEPIVNVDPVELVGRVEKMTPYEQMEFLYGRRSSLSALGIKHNIGDAALTPADIRTDSLYAHFKSYPDPKTHLLRFMPNPGHLSHIPILGWPYSRSWSKQKLFIYDSPSEGTVVNRLPVYEGDYYPLGWLSPRNPNLERLLVWSTWLKRYPGLEILILYAANEKSNSKEDNKSFAGELKRSFEKLGVKSKNIHIQADPTSRGGVTVAVGSVSTYSR